MSEEDISYDPPSQHSEDILNVASSHSRQLQFEEEQDARHANYERMWREEICIENINGWLETWGDTILAASNPNTGMTLFQTAVTSCRLQPADLFLELARERNMKVEFSWKEPAERQTTGEQQTDTIGEGVYRNLLSWATRNASYTEVEYVLDKLLDPEGDIFEIRRLLIDSFDELINKYPELVVRFFKNNRFSLEIAKLEVPASVLKNAEKDPVCCIVDDPLQWRNRGEELKAFLIENYEKFKEKVQGDQSGPRATAVAKAICFSNAILERTVACNIFLEWLLAKKAVFDAFKSETVKTLTQLLWLSVLKRRAIFSLIINLLASVLISIVAFFYVIETNQSSEDYVLTKSICVLWLFIKVLSLCGLQPAFFKIWFSILSVSLSMVWMSGVDIFPDYPMAVVLSIECLDCWASVLWSLQPFRATGPFVWMITSAISDVVPFVMITALITCAFGSSLAVLFPEALVESNDGFENFFSSVQTLFHAMLGNFDMKVFQSGKSIVPRYWGILLFNLFMFVGTIVLLTLLISVLSDTYDRVRADQKTELVRCRARIVASTGRQTLISWIAIRRFIEHRCFTFCHCVISLTLVLLIILRNNHTVQSLYWLYLLNTSCWMFQMVGASEWDKFTALVPFGFLKYLYFNTPFNLKPIILQVAKDTSITNWCKSLINASAVHTFIWKTNVSQTLNDSPFLVYLVPEQPNKHRTGEWRGKLKAIDSMLEDRMTKIEERVNEKYEEFRKSTEDWRQSLEESVDAMRLEIDQLPNRVAALLHQHRD